MKARTIVRGLAPVSAATAVCLALAACQPMDFGQGFVTTHTQGYEIPDSALEQIRPGQSVDLVIAVLGSPQTQGTFGEEKAFYYVQTKVQETAFGMSTPVERKVLAIYFDSDNKVKDKALYGLKDGAVFTIESRRTPSFGQDKTFVQSLLSSVTGSS